jgi:uncharacterized membrane protein
MLELGLSHLNATMILLGISLFFIILSFLLKGASVIVLLVILFSLGIIKSFATYYLAKKKLKKSPDRADA